MTNALELHWWGLAIVGLANIVAGTIGWCICFVCISLRCLAHTLAGTNASPVHGLDVFFAQALDTGCGMINMVVPLEGRANLKVWQDGVWNRLLESRHEDGSGRKRFPNFTKCVTFWFGYPMWTPAEHVDITQHVFEATESPVGSEEEFETVVNKYFNRVIPSGVPTWEIVLIHFKEGWRTSRHPADTVGGSCVLIRCHHSYADGVSIVRLASEVLANDQARVKEALQSVMSISRSSNQNGRKSSRLTIAVILVTAIFLLPFHTIRRGLERDRNILRGPRARRNCRKLYCWSRPLPLSKIKAVKNSVGAGCSVNDVVMSCVGGALRRWMSEQLPEAGLKTVPKYLKVYMPVSLRPLDEPVSDSNNMLLVTTRVLTGIEDPLERLFATKKVVDATKESQLTLWLDNISQRFSAFVFPVPVLRYFMLAWSPSLAYSNVPGPALHIDLLGNRMLEVVACVPHGNVMGLTISFMSYCDNIIVSVVMDSGISEDMTVARNLVNGVEDEINKLACKVTEENVNFLCSPCKS